MRTIKLLLICLVSVFMISVARGEKLGDKDTITWYRPDFPPMFILSGPDAGKGYSDQQHKMLVERLVDYNADYNVASYDRILSTIKAQNEKSCIANLLKNREREEYVEYSIPIRITFNNGVIIKKADWDKFKPYLDKNGAISLKHVLENKQLKLGVSQGRSYAKEIDPIIEENKTGPNLEIRPGVDIFKGLLMMMINGRVDYILGYPHEAHYNARQEKFEKEIAFIPISEIKQLGTIIYIGCTKNEWGKEVIKKINPVIKATRLNPEFLGYYESMLDDDTQKKYKKLVKEFFDKEN